MNIIISCDQSVLLLLKDFSILILANVGGTRVMPVVNNERKHLLLTFSLYYALVGGAPEAYGSHRVCECVCHSAR